MRILKNIYTFNVRSKWGIKNEDFLIRSIKISINILLEIILSTLRMTHRMISFKNNKKKKWRKKKSDFSNLLVIELASDGRLLWEHISCTIRVLQVFKFISKFWIRLIYYIETNKNTCIFKRLSCDYFVNSIVNVIKAPLFNSWRWCWIYVWLRIQCKDQPWLQLKIIRYQ